MAKTPSRPANRARPPQSRVSEEVKVLTKEVGDDMEARMSAVERYIAEQKRSANIV
jgi:hypothetical protein